MRQGKQGSESGRIWAGMSGILLVAAGAVLVGMVALSTDAPPGEISVAEASHATLTEEQIEALPNGTKIVICHTEGNGSQHEIEIASEALLNAGHFDAPGNPLHAVGEVHDFIISVEGMGVINDDECGAVPPTNTAVPPTNTAVPPTNTPTATQPVATSTQQVGATSTPTNTAVPPTNTPTATQAIATSTQQVQATSTPTNTAVAATSTPTATQPVATSTQQAQASSTPTNTAVPSTNTPTATNTAVSQNTPTATATVLARLANTPMPTPTTPILSAEVRGAQATPPPAIRALPAAGNGGYEDDSMGLIIGVAMILAGTSISLMAIRRQVR